MRMANELRWPLRLANTFSVEDDCLSIGGVSLTRLALQAGTTPFFAYSRQRIDEQVGLLRRYLPADVGLHYSVKANPFLPLVHHVARRVDGFDVASASELALALGTGVAARHISFSGPGKRDEALLQAMAAGVLVNVESPGELHRIHALAALHRIRARIALRINPPHALRGAGMRMGGGARPFGSDPLLIPAMLERIAEWVDDVEFEGFQIYHGTQNLAAGFLIDAFRRSVELILGAARQAPTPVRVVNLGGGFGVPYFEGDTDLDVAQVGAALRALAGQLRLALPEARIVLELGRFIVAGAGLYVSRVLDRKQSLGTTYLVVDGGMHHHLAASGNLGQVVRSNYPVVVGNRVFRGPREIVSVVGPLCTPLDMLLKAGELSVADVGDLIVVLQSGAYGLTASPTGFLSQPPAAEMIV
jgi:diaminopimelate decarboxylase